MKREEEWEGDRGKERGRRGGGEEERIELDWANVLCLHWFRTEKWFL